LAAISWGLLGPETLASERRTRTLGLGATVRAFNDLAVPGLGGVWFGKELLLATLGVAIAERIRNSGTRGISKSPTPSKLWHVGWRSISLAGNVTRVCAGR